MNTASIAFLRQGAAPLALSLALLATPATAQDKAPTTDTAQTETIVVTGSRIAGIALNSTSPVTLVTSEEIKLQGTARVEDLLNSLPSVFASQASTISNSADGTASVDLRGLGTSRTLSLVNGRRLVPGDPSPTSGSAADINLIPAAMLKRVEVLTGGASSVYGADAVAGVVNFIVDTDFEGFRVDSQYSFYQHNNRNSFLPQYLNAAGYPYPKGSTTDGDAIDATVAFGTKFNEDRGHLMAYFGYRKVKPITQNQRDYSSCVLQNTGAGKPRCGGSATSPNGNVLLFDTDVTSGSSTFYTFAPGGGFNNTRTLYNFAPLNYYQRNDERYTAGAFASYEVNDAIKPYMEFMFMDDRTTAQIAPSGDSGNTLTINCDNPLMSATQKAVICDKDNLINGYIGTFPTASSASYNLDPSAPPIDFPDQQGGTYQKGFFQLLRRNVEGGPRQNKLGHTTYRAVLGSKGNLGEAWNYDAYFQFGRNSYSQVYVNEFSVARLNRALDAVTDNRAGSPTFGKVVCRSVITGEDPNCVPYNVFGGAGAASPEAVKYLSAIGFQQGTTTEKVLSGSLTGDLGKYGAKLPWAAEGIKVNLGGEWRKEALDLMTDTAFQTGDLTGQGGATLPLKGSFTVFELFGEAHVPIITDSLIKDLTLTTGYRHSSYKTSANARYQTNTYKVGVELAPISDIRFRAMYNRAVRAPNIQELFVTPTVGLSGTKDPCAGHTITASEYGCIATGLAAGRGTTPNPAGQYNALNGGNPLLKPEKASTWTFGVVLQPSFVPRFSMTVDYFNIKVANAIGSFGSDAILSDCVAKATATFTPASCGLVHRDAAGSLWLTPGGYTTNLPGNVGSVQTAGIETNVNYTYPVHFGRIGFSLTGTYLDKYKVDNGLTDPYDCAGLYGPTCSSGGTTGSGAPLPRWRHKARLSLNTDSKIGVSLQWRYVGAVSGETTSPYSSLKSNKNFDPGLRIGGQSYFDLAASYVLKDAYTLRLGVNNLFDRQPPFVTSGNGGVPGTSLCPTGPCNGNTYPATYDALGRYVYLAATLNF